jgi:hypothetical protein
LVQALIERRRAEAGLLLDSLCVGHTRRGLDFAGYFRLVEEVAHLRLFSCSDPAEGNALLQQLQTFWQVEPLAKVLAAL